MKVSRSARGRTGEWSRAKGERYCQGQIGAERIVNKVLNMFIIIIFRSNDPTDYDSIDTNEWKKATLDLHVA